MKDKRIQERLLREVKLTLKRAVNICKSLDRGNQKRGEERSGWVDESSVWSEFQVTSQA